MVPQSKVAQRFIADRDAALQMGFASASEPLPVT
jgi:hypothetical protein